MSDVIADTAVGAAAAPRLGQDADFVPTDDARRAEARSYLQLVRMIGRRIPQPPDGAPVVLVPGFISGDVSLTVLARHLRRHGLRTYKSEIGANLGCTDDMVERLVARTERVVDETGRQVALVGHSRGGMIVNIAARRRPDLVSSVVVLCAPVNGTLSVATHVRAQLELLFRLRRRGWRVIGEDCVVGECGARIATELAMPFPANVPYLSVYSRSDAIIDWHTCLDPQADLVEVACSHTGMGTDRDVQRIVTDRLSELPERAAVPH